MTLPLNFETVGNADGPTLMLLHGFMSSNAQWDLNVDRLGGRLHLVLVELMGHGASPSPDDASAFELTNTLPAIERIRRGLNIERWWVGGHSMGGATAIRYALAHPEVAQGVVFTNTRAAFGLRRKDQDGQLASSENADLDTTDLRSLPFHPIHAKRFPENLKARMVAAADAMESHAIDHTMTHRHTWASTNDMHQLKMPVLLVNGRFERRFQPCVDIARDRIDNLTVVDLDGGHSINIEAAEAFDQAVISFIDKRAENVSR